MKTNVLVAILAGLMGGKVDPRLLPTERRTVKVRPANYTHPMVVSSPAEINAHNGRVALAKQDRKMQRQRTRRATRDWLDGMAGVYKFKVSASSKVSSSKANAYLLKQTRQALNAQPT